MTELYVFVRVWTTPVQSREIIALIMWSVSCTKDRCHKHMTNRQHVHLTVSIKTQHSSSSLKIVVSAHKVKTVDLKQMLLTFQNVDRRAFIALLDDAAALCQCGGIHAVHDGEDLTGLQVLHEIILQKSLLDQLSRPGWDWIQHVVFLMHWSVTWCIWGRITEIS